MNARRAARAGDDDRATTSTPQRRPRRRIVRDHEHAREERPAAASSCRSAIARPADVEQRLGDAAQPPRRPARDDRAPRRSAAQRPAARLRSGRATSCEDLADRISLVDAAVAGEHAPGLRRRTAPPSRSVAWPPAPIDDRRARRRDPTGAARAPSSRRASRTRRSRDPAPPSPAAASPAPPR